MVVNNKASQKFKQIAIQRKKKLQKLKMRKSGIVKQAISIKKHRTAPALPPAAPAKPDRKKL